MSTVKDPIVISDSLRILLAKQFTADQLRHLAALMDADAPGMRSRRSLDSESREELAELLTAGRTPTIGWWTRNTKEAG